MSNPMMVNEHSLTMLIGPAWRKMQFPRMDGAMQLYGQRYRLAQRTIAKTRKSR